MTALIIVDLSPTDNECLKEYSALAAKTLIQYQGEFISKGDIHALHGESSFKKKVIIQFPDKKSAENWYHSEDYQKIIPIRELGMKSQFHLALV
jgi:uncharacterized protein (DUF1330 family)